MNIELTKSDRKFMKDHDLTEQDMIGFIEDMERERMAEIDAILKEEAEVRAQLMNPEHD